jgi:hypothetical protein
MDSLNHITFLLQLLQTAHPMLLGFQPLLLPLLMLPTMLLTMPRIQGDSQLPNFSTASGYRQQSSAAA